MEAGLKLQQPSSGRIFFQDLAESSQSAIPPLKVQFFRIKLILFELLELTFHRGSGSIDLWLIVVIVISKNRVHHRASAIRAGKNCRLNKRFYEPTPE